MNDTERPSRRPDGDESQSEISLDPDLAICDPHHHLWDRPDDYYMAAELRADVRSGHNVVSTVFVECASGYRTTGPEALRPVGETEFVMANNPDDLICGIVGYADLCSPMIEAVLEAHVEAAGGRFRGVRNVSTWDPSPDLVSARPNPPRLLGQGAFRSGFEALGRAGLSFDAWLYHTQIPELTELARACPDTLIVLDHLGGPVGIGPYQFQREQVADVWRRALEELASCPNVFLKLGGIGMPIFGMHWHQLPGGAGSEQIAARWGEQIRWCIELFGVDRCMFESNFPVDRASCGYVALWNAFKRIANDASPTERAALFHDTAVTVYRL